MRGIGESRRVTCLYDSSWTPSLSNSSVSDDDNCDDSMIASSSGATLTITVQEPSTLIVNASGDGVRYFNSSIASASQPFTETSPTFTIPFSSPSTVTFTYYPRPDAPGLNAAIDFVGTVPSSETSTSSTESGEPSSSTLPGNAPLGSADGTTASTPSSSSSKASSIPVSTIIGASVGGTVFFALVLAAIFFLLRRRRAKSRSRQAPSTLARLETSTPSPQTSKVHIFPPPVIRPTAGADDEEGQFGSDEKKVPLSESPSPTAAGYPGALKSIMNAGAVNRTPEAGEGSSTIQHSDMPPPKYI